jgi:chromosomal replication initiator protein
MTEREKAFRIIEIVALYFGVLKERLTGRDQHKPIIFYRHILVKIIREQTQLSLKGIGRIMDGRDHTSIINSIKVTVPKEYEYSRLKNIIAMNMKSVNYEQELDNNLLTDWGIMTTLP